MKINSLELKNISKSFGFILANNKISLKIKAGEILALLGENGSGKSTLMNILSGNYLPDKGDIYLNEIKISINSPQHAHKLGIGMLHQNFKLIENMSLVENIALGLQEKGRLDLKALSLKIKRLNCEYGFSLDPMQMVYTMSVAQKQSTEIIKLLLKDASLLILDEPTTVLTLLETKELFSILKKLKEQQKSVIIITHKLDEVMEVADKVSILRKGQLISTVYTAQTNPKDLSQMMVGEKISLNISCPLVLKKKKLLTVKNLTCFKENGLKALEKVSFNAYGGEILGIAGIAGNGQKELLEAISGLQEVEKGSIIYHQSENKKDIQLVGKSPAFIKKAGISLAFVPEDRMDMGLLASMNIIDNLLLNNYKSPKSIFTNRKLPQKLAEYIIEKLKIIIPGINTPICNLSGGNLQKILVGREIATNPKILLTAYPVRGLDIKSSHTIHKLINQQKLKGCAILYVSEDLDLLLQFCDRILVLFRGEISGIIKASKSTKEELIFMMTNPPKEEELCL